MLCRGHSKHNKMSEGEMADKVKGFDTQNIGILFPSIDLHDGYSSSDHYSEDAMDEEIVDEAGPTYRSKIDKIESQVEENIKEESEDNYSEHDDMINENIQDDTTPKKQFKFGDGKP